ncbi:hypothetical protein F511_36288 [Dorcoceras hygrometricum]|uniref:Uncharacterized protein n=1 Tax=Dorcoceras hygrometricum TaxID=472368 RepID=A0A2Z7DBF2_9LAMI|nr:hypothetical protein F511_36288 [Dorcoceras hygrometricum]
MGPISNIGPKTSRAAQDRPEQNLEEKFSRRNDAGYSPDGGSKAAVAAIMHVSCGILPHIGSLQAWPFSAMHGSKMAHHLHKICARLATTGRPLSLPRRATKPGQRAGLSRTTRDAARMCAQRQLVAAVHGITDSACKNKLVMVSVQYGPFNTNIPIRSTIIGKSRVEYLCDPQWFRDTASRITDSACKNKLVMVSVQYGPFNTNIPIRSTIIGKSRVAPCIHLGDQIVTSRVLLGKPIYLKYIKYSGQRFVTLLSPQITQDIHAQGRAMNPRQRSINSSMHRDITQSRHLMTPTESVNGSK